MLCSSAMRCCSTFVCELIFKFVYIIIVTITEPVLAAMIERANFNQPVTLPCKIKCSGVAHWTMLNKPNDPVARCDQTTCSSQEGYNISHDQYLKGDLTLSVSAADYSKRTWYICRCKGKDVCEVRLSIEPLISLVQKRPGEDLLLDLSISDPVELIYNSRESEDSSGHRICVVEESELRCNPEYNQRASLNHSNINLRELNLSDSGVYIIQDERNKEIIHMYTVTVEEERPVKEQEDTWFYPMTLIALAVVITMFVMAVIGYLYLRGYHLRDGAESKRKQREEKNISPAHEVVEQHRSGLRFHPNQGHTTETEQLA